MRDAVDRGDVVVGEERDGAVPEGDGRDGAFVLQGLGVGEPGVVVDRGMQVGVAHLPGAEAKAFGGAGSVGADAVKMTECLHRLRRARTALYEQAYLESIEDPEFVDAVARITAAAKLLNGVAANMASAAAFIASLAGFLGAVGEVMPALTTHLG